MPKESSPLRRVFRFLLDWHVVLALAWAIVTALLMLGWWFQAKVHMPQGWRVYFIVSVIASVVTFVLYAIDKRASMSGGKRLPEWMLHLGEFVGGWPGAVLGQRTLRHKTRKLSYRVIFNIIMLIHVALIAYAMYLRWWK